MFPSVGDGKAAIATEEEQGIAIVGGVLEGVDGGFGTLFGRFAERSEEDVGQWVEPAVHVQDEAVYDAGISDMDGDAVAVATVQLFGEEH